MSNGFDFKEGADDKLMLSAVPYRSAHRARYRGTLAFGKGVHAAAHGGACSSLRPWLLHPSVNPPTPPPHRFAAKTRRLGWQTCWNWCSYWRAAKPCPGQWGTQARGLSAPSSGPQSAPPPLMPLGCAYRAQQGTPAARASLVATCQQALHALTHPPRAAALPLAGSARCWHPGPAARPS